MRYAIPHWEVVSERATSVIEKTTPAMVIMDPAMVPRTALAPSAPPVYAQLRICIHPSDFARSSATVAKAIAAAAPVMTDGTNQKLERNCSQCVSKSDLMTAAFFDLAVGVEI